MFRYSQLLQAIDNSDAAIINSFARVFLYKDFDLNFLIPSSIEIKFNAALEVVSFTQSIIQSTSWPYQGFSYFIGDDGEGTERNVYVYRLIDGRIKKVVNTIGTLNTQTGALVINTSLIPIEKNETVRIEVTPSSNDIITTRNNILLIDEPKSTVVGEIDTIAVAGVSGSQNYNTVARTSGVGGISSNQGTTAPSAGSTNNNTSTAQQQQQSGNTGY